jgi:hypothetical protein
MRVAAALLLGLVGLLSAPLAEAGGARDVRYGVAPDLKAYPQSSAKEAFASVLKAIDAKRIDYLAAQLADPAFIDERVKRIHAGNFRAQVEDTRARLTPHTVKQLRRFQKSGTWEVGKADAVVRLEGVSDRCVRLRLEAGRWYLEHSSALPKGKAPEPTKD